MRDRHMGPGLVAVLLFLILAEDARAQLKGHYIPGFTGLQSGSQPPPGISAFMPVYYYTTDDIKNDDGDSLPVDDRVSASFIGAGVAWVTNVKVLGANLGGNIVPLSLFKSRIEGPSLDVASSFDFSDVSIQPVQLGWHTKRADYTVGYNLFAPTGQWELGGVNNSGLGMWSHDLQAGATVYFDEKHQWNFAALGTYELHSHKKDTDIKVGDIFTVEGGLGRTFYKIEMRGETPVPRLITSLGVVYYGQWKVTEDTGSAALTSLLAGRKDRVYGAGVEGNVIWPESGLVLGLRAVPEFGARNRTEGWTFLTTVAFQIKSLTESKKH